MIRLAALIVEAVGDLVADDSADRAVIERGIGVRIEERRLKDGGGEGGLHCRRASGGQRSASGSEGVSLGVLAKELASLGPLHRES